MTTQLELNKYWQTWKNNLESQILKAKLEMHNRQEDIKNRIIQTQEKNWRKTK